MRVTPQYALRACTPGPAANPTQMVDDNRGTAALVATEASVAPDDSGSAGACPVVGIGASAGGLDAYIRLIKHVSPGSGLAYVLVQHLDPAHESQLPEILARAASIPVAVAHDGVRMRGDHVYVIPSGASMTVSDGHLRVAKRQREAGVHTVIDAFLASLADVHGPDAIGVVLSGAGSDGARGIRAVKEAGGITLAQDPVSAQFPSMPERAMATGCVDFVFTPEAIAERLGEIARGRMRQRAGSDLGPDQDDALKVLQLLRSRTGVDFRRYRRATVDRRILRRMVTHRTESPAEYLAHVRAHPEELDALYDDLLIGVTRFFRDPEVFETLKEKGFPAMLSGHPGTAPIRAWVAGCSGGEEAYSLAIALHEYLGDAALDREVHIFATDLSRSAIARARAGLYPFSIEEDVSPERLRRFFVREESGYRIVRQVRDHCVFATHNLLRDPPFSQLDLVSCRNVLIYFDPALQREVMPIFHYALNSTGLLLVGSAESASPEHFSAFDKRHRIFRPKPTIRRAITLDLSRHAPELVARVAAPAPPVGPSAERIQQRADRLVLDRFAPPSVVIDDQFQVVQLRGDTSRYLQLAPGAATLELFKLARPELLPALRAAIERAMTGAGVARTDAVALRGEEPARHVVIEVLPILSGVGGERHFVVVFLSSPPQAERATPPVEESARARARRPRVARTDAAAVDAEAQEQLREQLAEAHRHLQDIIEQYEAANEELRAANEEVQSSNEELQSTNEELETTKEEVQSTNEELTTVNEELRHRNRDLAALSDDLTNVFASTQIPFIIVDNGLRIRRFTPASDQMFKLIASDVGRPLSDVRARFTLDDLEFRVAGAIESLAVVQTEVLDDSGRWWSLTIRPYLTVNRRVDGAVLVFTDIDASKKSHAVAETMSENRRVLLVEAESARAAATEANMTKAAFLAHISHDLRTPLNAITGYADLLDLALHGPLTSGQQKDVDRIRRSARHLLAMITDILNFARVEAGELEIRTRSVALAPVLTDFEEMLHPQLRTKGLALDCGPCDGSVLADEEKLHQILLNMGANAIKFTDSGGVRVSCQMDDSVVRIQVSDTGRGIPPDQLERIFEPFVQLGRGLTSTNVEGVGLGLAVSRALARRMGGDLRVVSTVGEGSTFTLQLPRAVP